MMQCANSGLLLFDVPPVQTDIKSSLDIKYYPLSSLSVGAPIEFHVPGSVEEYIDCDHTYLEVSVKITKADGTAIDITKDKVGFSNLAISSMFSDVSLILQETQVEGGDCLYPYKAYFPTVMQFMPQAQNSHMEIWGWIKDQAGKMDDATNTAFVKRMSWTDKSKETTFYGPVFLDFFKQSKYLLSQTDMRLKFRLAEPEFTLLNFVAHKYKFEITKAILHVRRITVAPNVINEHAVGLEKHNAYYPLLHTDISEFTISKGNSNFTKDQAFLKDTPKFMMIGMLDNEAFNGTPAKNPFNFQHFNLSRLALIANGVSIPGQPVTPDFKNKSYVESYFRLMDAYHYFNTDDSNGLRYADFGAGYTLFAFDMTPDKTLTTHCIHPSNLMNLRMEFKFDDPLPVTVNVLVYAVYDSHIEITKLRDVIPAYAR